MKFMMNDPSYGYAGPYEAESKEDLVEGMRPTFEAWAYEYWNSHEGDDLSYRDTFIEGIIEFYEEEFECALEEVSDED